MSLFLWLEKEDKLKYFVCLSTTIKPALSVWACKESMVKIYRSLKSLLAYYFLSAVNTLGMHNVLLFNKQPQRLKMHISLFELEKRPRPCTFIKFFFLLPDRGRFTKTRKVLSWCIKKNVQKRIGQGAIIIPEFKRGPVARSLP